MGEEGRQTDTGIKVPKWRFMDYILGKLDFCFWLQTAFRILRSYSSLAGVPSFPILVCSPMIAMLAPDDFSGEAGMFDLELGGRVAIVTGGSDGLGRATARRLAAEGCKVVICARRQDYLQAAAAALAEETGGTVVAQAADVTRPADIEALVAATLERFGGIDILVNNAGLAVQKLAKDCTDDDYDLIMDTNQKGAWIMAQAVGRHMIEHGRGGKIINMSSLLALKPLSQLSLYAMSKAAVAQMTRALALEWVRHDIQVNAICPGYIVTEMNAKHWESEGGRALIQRMPARRIMQPEVLDGIVLLLASGASDHITGAVIPIDDAQSLM